MTMNNPILLTTISELWDRDPGAPTADYVKDELLKAYWEGGFPDGTVLVDTRQFLETVLPPDHDQNVWDMPPLEEITRPYMVERLADIPEGRLLQVLEAVRDGLANSAILASYPFNAYSPKQRDLIECLRLLPGALANWCDRTGRQRPSFLKDPKYGSPKLISPHTTRERGRPSNSSLYLVEFRRRKARSETERVLAAEARALQTWWGETYPAAPSLAQGTIENLIRFEHNICKIDMEKGEKKPTE